jgi:hypothetical protein
MRRLGLVTILSVICVAAPRGQEALTTKQRDSDLVGAGTSLISLTVTFGGRS